MLIQGKTTKYLIYAFGEIVLVVIGILIALQINNWNEAQKNKKIEAQYLRGISNNIGEDLLELKRHLNSDTVQFDALTDLVKFADMDHGHRMDSLKSNPNHFIQRLNIAFDLHWFEGQNIVFDDMKSSGKINLLQSEELKTKIQNYYKSYFEVLKQEEFHNSTIVKNHEAIIEMMQMSSSFLENTFPQRWNADVTPPEEVIIQKAIDPVDLENMMNKWSYSKGLLFRNHMIRYALYRNGLALRKEIETYLKN